MKFASAAILSVFAVVGASALQAPAIQGGSLGKLADTLSASETKLLPRADGTYENVGDDVLAFASKLYPQLENDAAAASTGSGQKPAALVHKASRRNAEDNSQTADNNAGMCAVGNPVCCNQEVTNDDDKRQLAGLAGVGDLVGSIGLACQSLPIGIAPVSLSNYCKSSPLCCTHVTQNGLVNLGCINVPLN